MVPCIVDAQRARSPEFSMPWERAHGFMLERDFQHVVRDVAFAKAFFAIWLDPRTRNPELRARLLGVGER